MEINSIILEQLLVENRIKKVKEKYPNNDELIDRLASEDPSDNNKYLMWMAKMRIEQGAHFKELFPGIELFHKQPQKFEQTDINQYGEWRDFLIDYERAKLKKSRKELRESGADKVYEDDEYVVIRPKTRAASCAYGSNTRWCISSRDYSSYFDSYTNDSTFFFIINKANPATKYRKGNYLKVAVQYTPRSTKLTMGITREEFTDYASIRKSEITYWNAIDNNITKGTVSRQIGAVRLNSMLSAMQDYLKEYHGRFYDMKMTVSDEDRDKVKKLKNRKKILQNRMNKLRSALTKINIEIDEVEKDIKYIKQNITRIVNMGKRLGMDINSDQDEILTSLGMKEKFDDLVRTYEPKKSNLERLQILTGSIKSELRSISVELGRLHGEVNTNIKYRD